VQLCARHLQHGAPRNCRQVPSDGEGQEEKLKEMGISSNIFRWSLFCSHEARLFRHFDRREKSCNPDACRIKISRPAF
jgi:hypothetical protein